MSNIWNNAIKWPSHRGKEQKVVGACTHKQQAKKNRISQKSKKFTKQVAVAPNSLLTGSPGPVFRDKTPGDVFKTF